MTVSPKRILYITHDGQLYGSQHSLALILTQLCKHAGPEDPIRIEPCVSIARPGPLTDRLADLPGLVLLKHQRLQWFKHDHRSALQGIGDCLALLINLPGRVLKLKRMIQQHQVDLVHTNSVVSLEGALAAKLAGVPHVWHIREIFMEDSPKLKPVLGKKLTRYIINRLSQRVVCISNAVQQQFSNPGMQPDHLKYPVIYNALDTEITSPSSIYQPQTPLRLGYVGRLSEGKRFHDVLDALTFLREQQPAARQPVLSVAGSFVDAPYGQRIQQQIQTAGLDGQVHMLGYLSDLNAFYPTIDLLIVPSLNEPFGRVVIEAMAAGVPCLGADSGGIPEIITHEETGWLYPATDTQALARQLTRLMSEPGALSRIRENALRMVRERFTIEQQRQHLLAVYQDVLSQRP